MLVAFDFRTKKNGFFKMTLNRVGKLQPLLMESFLYYFPNIGSTSGICGESENFFPLKAKNSNAYLVKRMSATEYPNLFVTKDFKEFRDLTHLTPQKRYNWYQSELCHWKLPDGGDEEGILYKPQNFDPRNKYPVIFYYYEKNADMLNFFINPKLRQWRDEYSLVRQQRIA